MGEDPSAIENRLGKMRDGSLFGEPDDGFQLQKRVHHILTEAMRVEDSGVALDNGDAERFAVLMNESHRSCRDDYEISCPELDVLAVTARTCGASGSRLTGAGFGGCAVSLVRDSALDDFKIRIWDEYYQRYLAKKRPHLIEDVERHGVIFVSKPAQGAEIISP